MTLYTDRPFLIRASGSFFNYSALYYARLVNWCVGYGDRRGIVNITWIMTKQVIYCLYA